MRIEGHDSIVFLRPPGGKVGYLPMIREGGRWRSTTLAPGIPLNPQIGSPKMTDYVCKPRTPYLGGEEAIRLVRREPSESPSSSSAATASPK